MLSSWLQLNSGAGLLKDMRQDLNNVVAVCEARKKQTNYLRSLISDLAKGEIRTKSLIVSRATLSVRMYHQSL